MALKRLLSFDNDTFPRQSELAKNSVFIVPLLMTKSQHLGSSYYIADILMCIDKKMNRKFVCGDNLKEKH
eukprot:9501825-Pyramimonas_sp.AAC.1